MVPLILPALVLLIGCGDSNVSKAKKFQDEKNFEQAIYHYKLALDKDAKNQTARYGLIEAYSQKVIEQRPEQVTPEQVELVMAELNPIAQPLMSDPNVKRYVSLVYQMVAKRYAEQGRHDKAGEAWVKVIEIEPTFAEAYFNYGLALTLVGNYEQALPQFEKSISLNPYFVKGYHAMGDAYLNLGRSQDAIQQYLKALELNPDDPAVHYNLGLAYFKGGNTDKAIAEYRKALEIEPNYSFAYKGLHDAYEKAGDKKNLKEIDKQWKERSKAYIDAVKENRARLQEGAPTQPEEAKAGS
jgi:tetratricopeptide (TPR) repeat protein